MRSKHLLRGPGWQEVNIYTWNKHGIPSSMTHNSPNKVRNTFNASKYIRKDLPALNLLPRIEPSDIIAHINRVYQIVSRFI